MNMNEKNEKIILVTKTIYTPMKISKAIKNQPRSSKTLTVLNTS